MAIDQKTKALVYYLSRIQGFSIRQVAQECDVSRATVWRISKMDMSSNGWKKTDRESDLPHWPSGGKEKNKNGHHRKW